jgi:hypothetical protein
MDEFGVFFRFAFLGFSLITSGVAGLALSRVRNVKTLFAFLTFFTLLVEAVLVVLAIFVDGLGKYAGASMMAGGNVLALVFLYLAILKR